MAAFREEEDFVVTGEVLPGSETFSGVSVAEEMVRFHLNLLDARLSNTSELDLILLAPYSLRMNTQ